MDKQLFFYEVDLDYIEYLHRFDAKVPYIDYSADGKHDKFLCGIVLSVNNHNYFAPISSFKTPQRTNMLIKNETGKVIASIRFSFMIPVPESVIRVKNFKDEPSQDYRRFLDAELKYCRKNAKQIYRLAKYIYTNVAFNKDPLMIKNCCDFKKLESACAEYHKREVMLVKPSVEYSSEIADFKQELLDSGNDFAGCSSLYECKTADEWICNAILNESKCPEGKVTSSSYLAIRQYDKRLVGITELRHHIEHPILSVWGGHMGYTVRPSERRKGYAKEMLRLNLINCRARGIDKVLITCDSDNFASEKTIVANGGVFEKEICVDGKMMKRFWVNFEG